MNKEQQHEIKNKLNQIKEDIKEIQSSLDGVAACLYAPKKIKDKAQRISSALGIDVDEIKLMKKILKDCPLED